MNKDFKDILDNKDLKKNPFTLPQGYFTQMEDNVREKIHSEHAIERGGSLISQLRTYTAMLAMFLLLFGVGYGVISTTGVSNVKYNGLSGIISIPQEDTLSDEELLIIFGQTDIYSTAESISTVETTVAPIKKDKIEEFLIDNNISYISILASLE